MASTEDWGEKLLRARVMKAVKDRGWAAALKDRLDATSGRRAHSVHPHRGKGGTWEESFQNKTSAVNQWTQ